MSAINPKQYVPFGKEWEREMEKFSKSRIIQFVREQGQEIQRFKADYALGQFDVRAYNHGCRVIEEMRNATGNRDGVAQSVVVVVFVDGFLQFAGANACLHNGANVTRDDAKAQAACIIERMSGGEVAKGEVAK